ncbi:MAG: histidine triad family protein [Actinomycetota bacterium]|jgi:histidine triad (HIT) family protein|nr:histidine triad family protein [Actinomycetota bacterium]
MASDCVFCRIIAGEIPSTEVASSDLSYAFRDIEPAMPVHVLVVPRRHIPSAADVQPTDADVLADMVVTAQRVARQEGLAERGYRLVFNVGDDALNSVAHLHLHLLGGQKMGWPPG